MNDLDILEEQSTQNPFFTFLTGVETDSLSPRQKRNSNILALFSLSTAVLFSVCIGWLAELHQHLLILSILIGACVGVLLLFFNRSVFVLHRRNNKASVWIVIAYIVFYGALSIWVLPQPIVYYFLLEEISKTKTSDSAMGEFSAMYSVIEKLSYTEKRVLTQYKALYSTIGFFYSLLCLVTHLLIQKNEASYFERDLENRRALLQRKLAEKQTEYSELFSTPRSISSSVDDPFFSVEEEPISEEQRLKKAESILAEIRHIQHVLQFIL